MKSKKNWKWLSKKFKGDNIFLVVLYFNGARKLVMKQWHYVFGFSSNGVKKMIFLNDYQKYLFCHIGILKTMKDEKSTTTIWDKYTLYE